MEGGGDFLILLCIEWSNFVGAVYMCISMGDRLKMLHKALIFLWSSNSGIFVSAVGSMCLARRSVSLCGRCNYCNIKDCSITKPHKARLFHGTERN